VHKGEQLKNNTHNTPLQASKTRSQVQTSHYKIQAQITIDKKKSESRIANPWKIA
jgi:hypothetical protein